MERRERATPQPASAVRGFFIRMHHNRCGALLAGLILFILLLPFVYEFRPGRLALFATYVALLIAVLRSLRSPGPTLSLNIALGVLYLVLVTAGIVSQNFWLRQAALTVASVFIITVMLALLRYVMDFSRVTADKLFGAVSIYVLLAFFFSDVYLLIENFDQGNFHYAHAAEGGVLDWSDFLYFSFTVLTSTGFGEITPISRLARSVVIIEQIMGVMYVAFLIARLTELYPSRDAR